jgi:HSP20 family protein
MATDADWESISSEADARRKGESLKAVRTGRPIYCPSAPPNRRRYDMATTLTEWRPFADFAELRNRLDEVFREIGNGERRGWAPSIDLVREKDRYVLRADVPGIKPDEINIEVDEGVLTISGEHKEEKEEKDEDYVRRERRYGSFSRSMTLPKGVEPDDIEATSKDGVLEVVIPAPKEEQKRAVTITPKTD